MIEGIKYFAMTIVLALLVIGVFMVINSFIKPH